MKLQPYTLWLDRCEFDKNEKGGKCSRCGQVLSEPLGAGTFFSCSEGRKLLAGYLFWCPGCESLHPYRIAMDLRFPQEQQPTWTFNGSLESPSFSPSLLVNASSSNGRCHLFVRSGQIEYCGDCDHALAGKVIPLPDIPDR